MEWGVGRERGGLRHVGCWVGWVGCCVKRVAMLCTQWPLSHTNPVPPSPLSQCNVHCIGYPYSTITPHTLLCTHLFNSHIPPHTPPHSPPIAVLGAKLKLKPPMIRVENAAKLLIFPDDLTKDKDREYEGKSLLGHMEELRKGLPGVVVSGVATVTRAIISQEQGLFKVFAEVRVCMWTLSYPSISCCYVLSRYLIPTPPRSLPQGTDLPI